MAEAFLNTSCVLITSIVFSIAFSGAVFWPLQSVGIDNIRENPKYALSDLFILMAQIQIVIAICYVVNLNQNPITMGSNAIFWSTLVVVWWWQGLKMLSRANVSDGNNRFFFIAVFCPIGFLISLSLILLPFWFLGAFVSLTVSFSLKEFGLLAHFAIFLVGGGIHSLIILGANRGCNYFVPDNPKRERRFVA